LSVLCSEARAVMRRSFPVVNKNDSLEHAYREMRRHGLDRAVVVDSGGRLAGIVTKKDIMRKLGVARTIKVDAGRMHVSSFMTPEPLWLREDSPALEAARVMAQRGIGSLPVLEGSGSLVGLLTRAEVAALAKAISGLTVGEISAEPPAVLSESDRVVKARQLLLESDALLLPVVSEGRVVGVVSIEEVADALFAIHYIVEGKHRPKRLSALRVAEIMKEDFPVIRRDAPVSEAVSAILNEGALGAVVTGEGSGLEIVTLKEVVELLARQSC